METEVIRRRAKSGRAYVQVYDHDCEYCDGGTAQRAQLYETEIVEACDGRVTLRDGGYPTATTVRRMNQASKDLGLGFKVVRRRGYMYVLYRGHTWRMGPTNVIPTSLLPYTEPGSVFAFELGGEPHAAGGCNVTALLTNAPCTPVKGIKHDG